MLILDDQILTKTGSDWRSNGTNPRLFQIRFHYNLAQLSKNYWNVIWKVLDLSHLEPFWPTLGPNRTSLAYLACTPDLNDKEWHWQVLKQIIVCLPCSAGSLWPSDVIRRVTSWNEVTATSSRVRVATFVVYIVTSRNCVGFLSRVASLD